MADYLMLNVLIMLVAVGLMAVCRFQGLDRRPVLITLGIMLALTVVFDNLIVGLHIVSYVRAHILGLFIGKAPLEDFDYTVTAVFLLPVIWHVMKGKYARKDR